MKKVLLLLCVSFFAFSCEKNKEEEKEYCWKCNTTATVSSPGIPSQTSYSSTNICNKTFDEKEKIEEDGTRTSTSTSGGVTVTAKYVTTCTKQ